MSAEYMYTNPCFAPYTHITHHHFTYTQEGVLGEQIRSRNRQKAPFDCCLTPYFSSMAITTLRKMELPWGLPQVRPLKNIFLLHHEQQWLKDCSDSFRPLKYHRYVDDTFAIFENRDQALLFLNYLNSQHPNIDFTMEEESDGVLPFLDVRVARSGGRLMSSIYRKPTFTGLGTSYYSNIYVNFKLSSVCTLIHRAYHLCSSFQLFHSEIVFLSQFFKNNGFPASVIDSHVRRFLDRIYSPRTPNCSVPRDKFYFRLPFYNDHCHDRVRELVTLLEKFYPQLHFLPSLSNPFTIGSLFRFKDALSQRFAVWYKFSCSGCDATYIGCTRQRFKARVCQHLGISDRTHNFLMRPVHSEPRNHSLQCSSLLTADQFSIINQCSNSILTLKSLHIKQAKPSLNLMSSSTPLLVA